MDRNGKGMAWVLGLFAVAVAGTGTPGAARSAAGQAAAPATSNAERAAIFKAAGAKQRGRQWIICGEDPQAQGATLDEVRDLNGDGRPEAIVSETGTFCYGFTGVGFQLLGQQDNGAWKVITDGIGIPETLKSKGQDGWPDLSIGGPGFCFPVQRWNGKAYVLHRHEYRGKACKPG